MSPCELFAVVLTAIGRTFVRRWQVVDVNCTIASQNLSETSKVLAVALVICPFPVLDYRFNFCTRSMQ